MFGCVPRGGGAEGSLWWPSPSTLSDGSTWYSHRPPAALLAARPGHGAGLDDDRPARPPSLTLLPPVQAMLPQMPTISSAERTVPGHMQRPD